MQKCANDECEYFKEYGECSSACVKNGFNKIITNFDRIKNMSFDEMYLFICSIHHEGFGFTRIGNEVFPNEDLKDWLKKEV